MTLWTIVLVGLLLAAAFSLATALVTHDGVGVIEYMVGFAAVAALLALAIQKSRRAITRA
jgi:lipid-A-disaccharide synthase-like uncharacterized protein